MELGIEGKRALVCAASKGIGRAIAMALAKEGVELFLCARNPEALAQAAREIEQIASHPVHYASCDLSDPHSREQLINQVSRVFKVVDILIHNTGGPKPSTVLETPMPDWEKGFHHLFESVMHLNHAFIPGMKAQQWGRILTVTSIAVVEPVNTLAISNAMRSAVTAMSKTLADEVAPYNITVNCLAPGIIHTSRTEERIAAEIARRGGSREEYMAQYLTAIPAGRLGTPEEFAAVAAFFCSQQASYVTGTTLCVDGGKRRATY